MPSIQLNVRRPDIQPKENGKRNSVKRGQKAKPLNNKITRAIFDGIRIGLPPVRAAELAGIAKTTYSKWMSDGKIQKSGKFHKFRKRVLQIQRERELEALDIIRKCGNGGMEITKTKIKTSGSGDNKKIEVEKTITKQAPQWQAHAWYLERMYKQYYGRETIIDDATPEERAKEITDLVRAIDKTIPTNGENHASS